MRDNSSKLLIADKQGNIKDVPFLTGVGMKAGEFVPLTLDDLIPLPACSQLFLLPDRLPVAFDPETRQCVDLEDDPLSEDGQPCFAVAAFLAPGYTATYHAAYVENANAKRLPLFAYSAVVFYKEQYYAAAVCVDRERRQDARLMDLKLMRKNIVQFKKEFSKNRLVAHLENCACVNGCPAAKNFFLKRYEAPLPTSPYCNAQCLGCISLQDEGDCPVTQPRIEFVPTPQEIAETALFHMANVKDPVVSFGQGCEGEPLMQADVLEEAIRLIRAETRKGIINLNTNASLPDKVGRLFDAGLDSMRVSINSVREPFYTAYYRPKGYRFDDVLCAINAAKKRGGFVSLNYLNMPGFTDDPEEFKALKAFVRKYKIDMIQWRNMNFDPLAYFQLIGYDRRGKKVLGMKSVIEELHQKYVHVMKGYFNPSRGRITRHIKRAKNKV